MMKHVFARVAIVIGGLATPFVSFALDTSKFVSLSPTLPIIGRIGQGADPVKDLLNGMLGISVALAAVLAVIMVAIGGFKYMTTDSVFAMSGAKEQIANAIIGLLIVLAAILLLKTINPDIVNMNLFKVS